MICRLLRVICGVTAFWLFMGGLYVSQAHGVGQVRARIQLGGMLGSVQAPTRRALVSLLQRRGFVVVSSLQQPDVIQLQLRPDGFLALQRGPLSKTYRIPQGIQDADVRARAIMLFLGLFVDESKSGAVASPVRRPPPRRRRKVAFVKSVPAVRRPSKSRPIVRRRRTRRVPPRRRLRRRVARLPASPRRRRAVPPVRPRPPLRRTKPRSTVAPSRRGAVLPRTRPTPIRPPLRPTPPARRPAPRIKTSTVVKKIAALRRKLLRRKSPVRRRAPAVRTGPTRPVPARPAPTRVVRPAPTRRTPPVVRRSPVVSARRVALAVVPRRPVARRPVARRPVARRPVARRAVRRPPPRRRVALGIVGGVTPSPKPTPWWFGVELAGALSPTGVQGVPLGGSLGLVGGWRWLGLRLDGAVFGVAASPTLQMILFRPSLSLDFAILRRSRFWLSLGGGGFAELFFGSDGSADAMRYRFGVKGYATIAWQPTKQLSLFASVEGLFSPLELLYRGRRQEPVYRTAFGQLNVSIGLRFLFW